MTHNHKRMRKLLVAQKKAHAIAAANAGRAHVALLDAMADQEKMVLNASGENSALPPGVVHALCNAQRRSQRIDELASGAERLRQTANGERRLERQIERVIDARRSAEAARKEASELIELLDAIAARRMATAE